MKYLLPVLMLSLVTMLNAQSIGVNANGALPDNTAMLDISSNSKGVLIPRLFTFQRNNISNPATGLLVYDVNADAFFYYDGNEWLELLSSQEEVIAEIADTDGDTYIDLESSPDDDQIKMASEGTPVLTIKKNVHDYFVWDVLGTAQNVPFGDNTGNGLRSGSFGNVLFGNLIMDAGEGRYNTFIGHAVGTDITDADDNTAVGGGAAPNLTTGSNNTIIGRQAGHNTTTGSSGVFIGSGAGYIENQSNRLHIANSPTSNPTRSLVYGQFDNEMVRINGELQIRDEYAFPEVDGTAGQVLATDGSGSVTWSTVSGGGGGGVSDEIVDTDGDTKIQVEESTDDDIIRFDIGGTEKFSMMTNASSSARLAIVNNQSNVLIGESAGLSQSTGSSNVMIGTEAGRSNNGSGNVFLGTSAGRNSAGSNQLIIDNSSTSSPLIAGDFSNNDLTFNADVEIVGNNAVTGNHLISGDLTVGNDMNVIGDAVVTGDLQVSNAYTLPTNAGSLAQVLTMGTSGSTYWSTPSVGGGGGGGYWSPQGANALSPDNSQNVCINCPPNVSSYSSLAIGAAGAGLDKEVTITSDKRYALKVESSYISNSNTADGIVRIENTSNSGTSSLYAISSDTLSPTARFTNQSRGDALSVYSFYGHGFSSVAGFDTARIAGSFSATNGFAGTGVNGIGSGAGVKGSCTVTTGWDFYAAGAGGDYGTMSSRRWKTDIRNIDDPIAKLKALRGVYYTWDEDHGGHHDVGFIAEEIAEQLPEIVQYDDNGVDVNGLDYSKTTPLILEAVKTHIEAYEKKISTLENRLSQQDQELQIIKDQLKKLMD